MTSCFFLLGPASLKLQDFVRNWYKPDSKKHEKIRKVKKSVNSSPYSNAFMLEIAFSGSSRIVRNDPILSDLTKTLNPKTQKSLRKSKKMNLKTKFGPGNEHYLAISATIVPERSAIPVMCAHY